MTDEKIFGVVNYAPKGDAPCFQFEELQLISNEPGEGEVLVRFIASGICHTDLTMAMISPVYPKMLGHEGAGYVEKIGTGVTTVQIGDPVLMSYDSCGCCYSCTTDHPVYCDEFNQLNLSCSTKTFKTTSGQDAGGKFFGQSSFAAMGIVSAKSIVNVKGLVQGEDELKLFSPLGCGFMTGSGAVMNAVKPKAHDIIIIAGLGAVGFGAVVAARLTGVKAVIAVDRIKSRLRLAKELGANYTYNTESLDKEGNLAEELQKLVPNERMSIAIETTGATSVISACLKAVGKRGKLIQIALPTTEVKLDPWDLLSNSKRIEFNCLGESMAGEALPKMIKWYRDGTFPIDRMVKFYAAKDIEQALQDMRKDVIKPVIVHDTSNL